MQALTPPLSVTSVIIGDGRAGLTKLGAGELSVVLDNTSYTGITKVDGGTLVLGNNTVNNTNHFKLGL